MSGTLRLCHCMENMLLLMITSDLCSVKLIVGFIWLIYTNAMKLWTFLLLIRLVVEPRVTKKSLCYIMQDLISWHSQAWSLVSNFEFILHLVPTDLNSLCSQPTSILIYDLVYYSEYKTILTFEHRTLVQTHFILIWLYDIIAIKYLSLLSLIF